MINEVNHNTIPFRKFEEGNLIVLGFNDKDFFNENHQSLGKFIGEIKKDKSVELSLFIEDLKFYIKTP